MFINTYLTYDEKERFAEAKIKDPINPFTKRGFLLPAKKNYLTPSRWTKDITNKIALIYCGNTNPDEHNKQTFAVIYKEINAKNVIITTLIYKPRSTAFSKEEYDALRIKYHVGILTKWEMVDLHIPKELRSVLTNEEIYSIITDALCGYGDNGKQVYNVQAFLDINM